MCSRPVTTESRARQVWVLGRGRAAQSSEFVQSSAASEAAREAAQGVCEFRRLRRGPNHSPPWPCEWVPITLLKPDLKREAREMETSAGYRLAAAAPPRWRRAASDHGRGWGGREPTRGSRAVAAVGGRQAAPPPPVWGS